MTPRSELGRLDVVLKRFASTFAQATIDAMHTPRCEQADRQWATAARQRKAIIERVRKLIKAAERRGALTRGGSTT